MSEIEEFYPTSRDKIESLKFKRSTRDHVDLAWSAQDIVVIAKEVGLSPRVIQECYFRPIQEISIPIYAALTRAKGMDFGLLFNDGHGPIADAYEISGTKYMRPERDDSTLMHAHFLALHALEALCKWFDLEPLRGDGPSGFWRRYEETWSDKRRWDEATAKAADPIDRR